MSAIHSKDVDNYITAGTLAGLRRSMRKLNAKYGAQHQFHSMGHFLNDKGKITFYAWYKPTERQTTEELDEVTR